MLKSLVITPFKLVFLFRCILIQSHLARVIQCSFPIPYPVHRLSSVTPTILRLTHKSDLPQTPQTPNVSMAGKMWFKLLSFMAIQVLSLLQKLVSCKRSYRCWSFLELDFCAWKSKADVKKKSVAMRSILSEISFPLVNGKWNYSILYFYYASQFPFLNPIIWGSTS